MTEKEARELLKQAADPYRRRKHNKYLRDLARMQMRRVPSLYKTKEAKGWDMMVETLVATSPAGSSAR